MSFICYLCHILCDLCHILAQYYDMLPSGRRLWVFMAKKPKALQCQ